jgi:hypothetical protein
MMSNPVFGISEHLLELGVHWQDGAGNSEEHHLVASSRKILNAKMS